MTRQEEKQQLRAIVRRLEAALTPEYKAKSGRAIVRRLLAMPEYQEAQTVFCFVGTTCEIDTRPILEDILSAGKTLCVPRCTAPGHMEPRQITDLSQLSPGAYGILEPSDDAAGPRQRRLRPLSLPVPGRHGAAVPGTADPAGNPRGAPRLPGALGADRAGII